MRDFGFTKNGVPALKPEAALNVKARYFESEYVEKDGSTQKSMQASSIYLDYNPNS